jgi:hypothetical protein
MRRSLPYIFIVAATLFMPMAAHAAIVSCGSTGQAPCSPCDLFATFHNLLDFVLRDVTGPVAAGLIVIAGGMMLLSGGNATRFSSGKKMLTNTLIGVGIILLSWVFVNFLIKSLATGNQGDTWYQFSCPAGLSDIVNIETTFPSVTPPPVPTPLAASVVQGAYCTPTNLSAKYGTAISTTAVSDALTKLMNCLQQDPIVNALRNPTNQYTYEQDNPSCNLSRGNPVCPNSSGVLGCAHAVNSCHYGGKTGNQGAMAVDYNAKNGVSVTYVITTRAIVASTADSRCNPPGTTSGALCRTVTGEEGLFDELFRVSVLRVCPWKFVWFEKDKSGHHTHMTALGCDSDGSGPKDRVVPPLP